MKRLNDALSGYMGDYLNVYISEYNLDPDNADQYIEDEEYLAMMQDDLEDKGFSKEEANGIVIGQMDKETTYKFMAYYINLGNFYNNIDSLKDVIENGYNWSVDDFTEEELNNILKYSKKLK